MATLKRNGKLQGGLEGVLRGIAQRASKAKTVDVGFLENATYPDGTSVPMVAAIQEFGAPARNIPPRPFFRSMIAAKSPGWPTATATALKANDYDAGKTLAQVGDGVKGQLQESITSFIGAPLSAKTIKRKGFDRQLVDSGVMLNSVDYQVKT